MCLFQATMHPQMPFELSFRIFPSKYTIAQRQYRLEMRVDNVKKFQFFKKDNI